jgi:exonuclease III
MNSNHPGISILQYNLNRCQTTTQSLLNHPNSKQLAILAVQEQYCPKRTQSSLPHQSWTIIETPSSDPEKYPRAVIYVNKRILPSRSFQPVHYPSSDVAIIEVKMEETAPMLIINIYNTRGTPLINDLATFLRTHLRNHKYDSIAIVGDFNLHHPLWNPAEYDSHHSEAEDLIDLMATNGLDLILPAGTITFPRSGTTLDLTWGNAEMRENVVKCKVSSSHDHGSDHYPIITTLYLKPEEVEEKRLHDFEKTDWDLLKAKLKEGLPPITDYETATPVMVDKLAEDITKAMREAIEESTPRRRICPFSKRWWNEDLTKERREASKARNRFKRTRDEECRREWREKEKAYKRGIKKCKRKTWRKFVKEADERSIWKIKKYMDSGVLVSTYIPTINETASSNDDKAEIFRATFFPPPPPADLTDIETYEYPESVPPPPGLRHRKSKPPSRS